MKPLFHTVIDDVLFAPVTESCIIALLLASFNILIWIQRSST